VGDNEWTQSGCRSGVWNYGVPGSGMWQWTATFGYVWISDSWWPYMQQGFECGGLQEACKPWGYMSEVDAAGQWYRGGRIYRKYGYWHVELGNWGQTGGRLAEEASVPFPDLPGRIQPDVESVVPPRPRPTAAMRRLGAAA
jgi:hypothetical protein